jgi:hypothetical protein
MRTILFVLSVSSVAWAQNNWELGAAGAYSYYKNATVTNATGSATAGFDKSEGFSVSFGEALYNHLGGEFRYTFLLNKLLLSGEGQKVTRDAHAHAVHYDLLFFAKGKEARIRPFLAGGAGVRVFSGTGVEQAAQPLNGFVALTHTNQVKALVSAGGGVQFKISKHALFRVDFRDYISPIPQSVLTPAPGARLRGLLNDFVGFGGVSYTF